MSKVRPGTPFEVEYADGLFATVRTLHMEDQTRLINLIADIQDAEKNQDLRVIAKSINLALQIAMVEVPDGFTKTIDMEEATEICKLTIAKTGLNDDEEKKSESPH